MANERLSITILNWQKWQPRADVKRPTWFAMSNDLLDHPDFVDFSPVHFHALVYIFSQASRRGSPSFSLVFAHAKQRNITERVLIETIEKLERIQCVRIDAGDTNVHERARTHTFATDRQTDTTDITDKQTEPAAQFEFQKAFELYPLKIKGGDAEKRFRQQITSAEIETDLHKAIRNYCAMLKLETWRRPKQTFAAFLGTQSSGFFWRDFIDWTAPVGSSGESEADLAERLIREHQEVAV